MAVDNEIQLDRLARSFAAVGELIDAIQPRQWSAPTQCMDWTVHRLVEHLVGRIWCSPRCSLSSGRQRGDGCQATSSPAPIGNRLPCCSTRLRNQAFSIALPGPTRCRHRREGS